VEVVGDGVLVELGQAALLRPDRPGEVAEVVDGERDVGGQRLPDRLAVLPGLGDGELGQVACIRSAILFRISARSAGGVRPQAGAAACAASRARSTSAAVPRAISVKICPVAGAGFSKYLPLAGATYSPPIQWSYRG
jgi:hypothetical protein